MHSINRIIMTPPNNHIILHDTFATKITKKFTSTRQRRQYDHVIYKKKKKQIGVINLNGLNAKFVVCKIDFLFFFFFLFLFELACMECNYSLLVPFKIV